MRSGLILKKIGMTRVFDDLGDSIPVTVLKLEENQVVKILNRDKNGYTGMQVGCGKIKTKKLPRGQVAEEEKYYIPQSVVKEYTQLTNHRINTDFKFEGSRVLRPGIFDFISMLAIFFSKNKSSSIVYFFDALVYFVIKKEGIYGFDLVGFVNE